MEKKITNAFIDGEFFSSLILGWLWKEGFPTLTLALNYYKYIITILDLQTFSVHTCIYIVGIYIFIVFFPFCCFTLCRNSTGCVYLQYDTMEAAINAQRAMHMRWFAGRQISVLFMVRY